MIVECSRKWCQSIAIILCLLVCHYSQATSTNDRDSATQGDEGIPLYSADNQSSDSSSLSSSSSMPSDNADSSVNTVIPDPSLVNPLQENAYLDNSSLVNLSLVDITLDNLSTVNLTLTDNQSELREEEPLDDVDSFVRTLLIREREGGASDNGWVWLDITLDSDGKLSQGRCGVRMGTLRCSMRDGSSRVVNFIDYITLTRGCASLPLFDNLVFTRSYQYLDTLGQERERGGRVRRVHCAPRSPVADGAIVRVLNSTELLQHLGTRGQHTTLAQHFQRQPRNISALSSPGRCTVVLFFAPWCQFCARVAPEFNALARVFPTLDVVAIDAYMFSHLNSRFGTISVPNIMLFHNAKAVARFNTTNRTLPHFISFVYNHTGIQGNTSVMVTDDDHVGPLSSVATVEPDYLLALSWVFVIGCTVVAALRSRVGVQVWNTLLAIGRPEDRHIAHLD